MGEIREEVESFYMRDYVEEKVTIMVITRMSSVTLMLNCRWRQDSLSNSASPTWYKNFSTLFVHLEKNISSIKTKCNTMLMEIMLMIALAFVHRYYALKVFSRNKRVKDVRWHPKLGHVVRSKNQFLPSLPLSS